MVSLSTRTIAILAAICFVALIFLQLAWLRSAYQGELTLYTKEKKQFESELQDFLRRNEQFKKQLIDAIELHEGDSAQMLISSFSSFFTSLIDSFLQINARNVTVTNYGIRRHDHSDSTNTLANYLILAQSDKIVDETLKKSGNICLHCILERNENDHNNENYQLVLFYGGEQFIVYKKLGWLIGGCLLLLLLLGWLFWKMIGKYQQEKLLSEAKNDFINNLSHELQTPVFAIQMANRLVREKSAKREDLSSYTAIIEKESSQIKAHVTKILELASVENEQIQLDLKRTDLNGFLEERKATVELLLAMKNGKLNMKKQSDPLFVNIDPVHFNNVLTSLVDNAIKYNKRSPEISIETGEHGDIAYMSVRDNGIGIEGKYLPHVFNKFYRVPEVKRKGFIGFGLGLSYAEQVVKLHRGKIDICSEVNEGTVIRILIPKA